MAKTILLEIDVEEGEDYVVKELLAYLAYTKRIRKYLWQEKEAASPRHQTAPGAAGGPSRPPAKEAGHPGAKPSPPPPELPAAKGGAAGKSHLPSQMMISMLDDLSRWKKENRLIRLKALKGKGKFLDIACKIVSHDGDVGTVTVYDVDRKVVETVLLTEIEDIGLAL